MAFMWKEESSYNYKLELDDDIDDHKSINKTSKRMLQLGAATASNWGDNVFQLMLFKCNARPCPSHDTVINEFDDKLQLNPVTESPHNSKPTNTIGSGNKAIKASVIVDTKNGEYILKLTTVKSDSVTAAEQVQTAATLLSQAALLRQLGEKLLFQSEVFKSLDI